MRQIDLSAFPGEELTVEYPARDSNGDAVVLVNQQIIAEVKRSWHHSATDPETLPLNAFASNGTVSIEFSSLVTDMLHRGSIVWIVRVEGAESIWGNLRSLAP